MKVFYLVNDIKTYQDILIRQMGTNVFRLDNTIWKDLNTNGFSGNQGGGEEFSIDCFEIFFIMLPRLRWKYVGI